ncbi:MAG: Ldh family oxidoreductase [Bacteroidales bacterium]|nr:Ldh family oxidoreductase [Bacteroidales bacterium]MBN2697756.1 Ldh family oxidoreductase [Bacteroidales bacterium]
MYTIEYLENFTRSVFEKMGCNREDAITATRLFIAAELRGLPSHGMIRIKDYFQLWEATRINVRPNITVVHETPSTAVVDGDGAIGMIAATKSMELAIEKARKAGTGWVSTRNSNHFGIAGYYSMMALEHDMIGICMTIANPLVAPTWSVSRMLGTNPIAVAVPAGKHPPFVADFSTTPIARGKLAVAGKKGEKVPLGYVQDADGLPSDDPDIIQRGGSMVTLGGTYEHGSHKGYCLSAIVDIFSAVFSGANFGPFCPPSVAYLPVMEEQVGLGTGHFFGAMRIDGFQPPEVFKSQMDRWIETFRAAKPAKGHERVLIPGDPEREKEKEIRKNGVAIIDPIQKDLKEIADFFAIEFEMGR